MADISAGQIEPPLHFETRRGFKLLRDEFSQNHGLGKVLGTNDYAIGMRRRASGQQCGPDQNQKKPTPTSQLSIALHW